MRVVRVLSWFVLAAGVAGCQQAPPAQAPPAAATSAAPAAKPYGSLAQVMRGIPFPNSNIIFDTQSSDPGAPKKSDSRSGGDEHLRQHVRRMAAGRERRRRAVGDRQSAHDSRPPVRERSSGPDRAMRCSRRARRGSPTSAPPRWKPRSPRTSTRWSTSAARSPTPASSATRSTAKCRKEKCAAFPYPELISRSDTCWMYIRSVFEWVNEFPTSIGIRESIYLYPAILTTHIVGMCTFAGLVIMMDLRLLGIGNTRPRFRRFSGGCFRGRWSASRSAPSAVWRSSTASRCGSSPTSFSGSRR